MQSRFIRLTDYCLVEYQFESLSPNNPTLITDSFYKLLTDTGEVYLYNPDSALAKTGNIKDLTVIPSTQNGGRLVYLDTERIPNYTEFNTNLIESVVPGGQVISDRVRFHLATGFQFSEVSNLVFSIKQTMNDGNSLIFANILVNAATVSSTLKYNTRPMIIGNTMYDRYIDVLIPSIKNIDEEYLTAQVKSNTFEYKITNGSGLIRNNPISISLFECSAGPIIAGAADSYTTFDVNNAYTSEISQSNEFSLVGATIREATDGDYIEFFATYDSAFPEEFIGILQKRTGNPWIIFHQLSIYEQVGTGFIKTGDATFFQDTNFDEPLTYRPILKNANEAVTMTIDYSLRLVNNTTNEQIIRTASVVVLNPNKYGKSLIKLNLANPPESQKISNLIIKKSIDSVSVFTDPATRNNKASTSGTAQVEIRKVTEYVPVFYANDSILLTESSALVNGKGAPRVAYGQGKLPIGVNQFDNAFKFKVLQIKPGTTETTNFDLSNFSKFELVFGTGTARISVSNTTSQSKVDAKIGEILFNMNSEISAKVLELTDNKFYIVSVAKDGTKSALYTGTWFKPEDITQVDTQKKAEEARLQAEADLQSQLKSLRAQLTALKLENDQLKNAAANSSANIASPAGSVSNVPPVSTPVSQSKPPRETNYSGGIGGSKAGSTKPAAKAGKQYYVNNNTGEADLTGPGTL